MSFIPVAIWLWALYEKSGYDAVHTVVWTNNFGRFSGEHKQHIEPFHYYFPKLFEQLQPWTILLPFALWFNIRKIWRKKDNKALFMLCWLIIPYLLLMISAGKRPVYVLPLYAAEILLIANMLDQIYRDKFKLPAKWDYINLLTGILGIVFTVALLLGGIVFSQLTDAKQDWTINIAPALMFACGMLILYFMSRQQVGKICLALLIGLAATYISVDTIGRSMKNHQKSYHNMFKYCEKEIKTGKVLYLYQPIERESGAALFYLGQNCPNFDLKTTKAAPNIIVLLNAMHSEQFLKAGFKLDKEFQLKNRKYRVMKYER